MLSKRLTMAAAGVASIPADLIVFFNDTSIPTGWTRFSATDNKRIVGAGTTYDPGDTGGDNNITISSVTSDSYSHGYSGANCPNNSTPQPSGGGSQVGDANISHSHDFSKAESSLEPEYQQTVMIKSDSAQSKLPQNTLALWHLTGSDPSGLTQQYTAKDDVLIRSGSTITSDAGTTTVASVASTSNGSHTHADEGKTGGGGENSCSTVTGAHSHTVTMSFTFDFKRALLGLWTNASADFDLEANMIGLYESTTPPSGWYLCDGSNGTPDMRDRLLAASSQSNQGTLSGDDTLSCTHANDSWSHGHCVGDTVFSPGSCYHPTHDFAHAHTLAFSKTDHYPTYYGLAFIMYGG